MGSRRSMSWSIKVKMAVFAPIPRASEKTAPKVNSGALRSVRTAKRKSCRRAGMTLILPNRETVTTKLPLPVERFPGKPAGAIVRFGLVQFDCAQIGGAARVVVVDGGQKLAGINGFGVG